MDLSVRAQEFLHSLDPRGLKVGDGSDHLPVWIGIDAEAGRVYKVYASGLATGFGDGRMMIVNGLQVAPWRVVQGEQVTAGKHLSLADQHELRAFEAEPTPLLLPEFLSRDHDRSGSRES